MNYSLLKNRLEVPSKRKPERKKASLLIISEEILKLGDDVLSQPIRKFLSSSTQFCDLERKFGKSLSMVDNGRYWQVCSKRKQRSGVELIQDCRKKAGAGYDTSDPSLSKTWKLKQLIDEEMCHGEQYIYRSMIVCLQAHCFDGAYEPKDVSVFDYLMGQQHLIILMSQTGSLIDFKEKQHVYWHLKDGGIKVDLDRLNLPNREEFPYKYLGWTQFDALFAKLCILRQIQAGVICVTKIPPKREVVINPSWDETPYFNRNGLFEIDYLDTIQVDTNDMDPIPDYPVIDIKSKLGLSLIQFHSDIIRGSLRNHSNFSQKCFQCHYCETAEFDQDQLVQHLADPAHKEYYQIKNEYRTYYKEIDQLLSEYREAFESQIKPLKRIIKEEPIIKCENTVRKRINLAQRFQEMRMVKVEESVKLEDIQVKIKEG